MKIAFVTDTYLPRINGVSVSVDTLASELLRLGHDVHIYAPDYPTRLETAPTIHRFSSWKVWFSSEDRVALPLGRLTSRSFRDQRFDVVHTHTPFSLGTAALRWARASGARIVHTYHTVFSRYAEHYIPFVPESVALRFIGEVSRRYCHACDLVVTPSDVLRTELLRFGIQTPITVIPTGVNLDFFQSGDRSRFRQQHGIRPTERCLLFVGRLAGEKNLGFLLEALKLLAAELNSVRLLIAGAGPAEGTLRARASELGVDEYVTFLGYLRGEQLADCYAGADVFAFPSVTESQGVVVAEALAAGLPVVAIAAMGVKESLADEQGGILTRADEREFAGAVRHLLVDDQLYEQKRRECQAQADNWSSSTMAGRMLEAYQSVIDRPAAGRGGAALRAF